MLKVLPRSASILAMKRSFILRKSELRVKTNSQRFVDTKQYSTVIVLACGYLRIFTGVLFCEVKVSYSLLKCQHAKKPADTFADGDISKWLTRIGLSG